MPRYVLISATSGPTLATTSAVLSQGRDNNLWQTTVILSQATGKCPGPASGYWLETTSPDQEVPASNVTRVGAGPCRVTVKFAGAPKAPQSAVLVLDEAGVVSSTQLSLQRNVTWHDYILAPVLWGMGMAIVLLLAIGFFAGFREEGGTWITLNDPGFWTKTVSVSQKPKINLVPIATIVATFLGAGTLANSLFPGISVGDFVLLTAAVEALAVVGGGVAYDFFHWRWVRRHPPNELGLPLVLTKGGSQPSFTFPPGSNASIESTGNLRLKGDQANTIVHGNILIPDGSKVDILGGTSLLFPEGTNVLLGGTALLRISKNGAGLVIDGITYPLPRDIEAEEGLTIKYSNEVQPDFSAAGAKGGRRRYGKRTFKLTPERHAEPQANIPISLIPVLAVAFGIGAELGVIGVLSIVLSDATKFGRFIAADLIAVVALFVIYHTVWKIRRDNYIRQVQPGLSGAISLPPQAPPVDSSQRN